MSEKRLIDFEEFQAHHPYGAYCPEIECCEENCPRVIIDENLPYFHVRRIRFPRSKKRRIQAKMTNFEIEQFDVRFDTAKNIVYVSREAYKALKENKKK